ncbi:MAG: hypothetical protein H6988_13145 [Pseudomonadales bacterium]|nr:hypothetical protein [Pseudomonadales bacterium]
MKHLQASTLLIALALLSGCGTTPPLTIAMTEMGTATKTEKGSRGLRLMRVVDVTGLNSQDEVGTFSLDPDPPLWERPPFLGSDASPDALSTRLTPGCSMIVETTFVAPSSELAVVNVRDKLIDLDEKSLQAAQAHMHKTLLEAIDKKYKAEQANTPAAAAPPAADPAQAAEPAKTEEAAAQPATEEHAATSKLFKLAADIDSSVKDGATLTAAVEKAGKQAAAAAEAMRNTKNALDKLLAEPGIVVSNWTRKVNLNVEGQAADIASANYTREKEVHGYLVMAGLRTATLVPGKDLLYAYQDSAANPVSKVKKTRLFVTQYTQSAKYLAWSESRFSSVEAGLQASVDKLLEKWNALEAAKDLTQVLKDITLKVGAEYANNLATSNTGAIANGQLAAYRFSFSPEEYQQAWLAALKRSSGYRTVYASRATLLGLMGAITGDDGNCKDASKCNNRCPPNNFYDTNLIPAKQGD